MANDDFGIVRTHSAITDEFKDLPVATGLLEKCFDFFPMHGQQQLVKCEVCGLIAWVPYHFRKCKREARVK